MGNSRIRHLAVLAILGAYIVPGLLCSSDLLGRPLFVKLDASLSAVNDRSIDLDERPYWTSHRHLIFSEHFSDDQSLNAASPWISVVTPRRFSEIPQVFIPSPIALFRPNPLRAPPPCSSNDLINSPC